MTKHIVKPHRPTRSQTELWFSSLLMWEGQSKWRNITKNMGKTTWWKGDKCWWDRQPPALSVSSSSAAVWIWSWLQLKKLLTLSTFSRVALSSFPSLKSSPFRSVLCSFYFAADFQLPPTGTAGLREQSSKVMPLTGVKMQLCHHHGCTLRAGWECSSPGTASVIHSYPVLWLFYAPAAQKLDRPD